MDVPDIQYARSGDLAIAYQTFGDGPRDIVFIPMFSNLVFPWANADWRATYERFATFSRLIMFDKRGTGLSDRPRELGTLETRMDDIRAVLDAVGTERATLVGLGEGGHTSAVFAATYPERTEALVLVGTRTRVVRTEDYPYGVSDEEWRDELRAIRERWGTREFFEAQAREMNPDADEEFMDWFVTCQRFCASPGAALTFFRVYGETDLRDVLATIRVPTLVLYRRSMREQMLDLAGRIKDAQAVEIDEASFVTGFRDMTREVEVFLSHRPAEPVPDTVLATVLFTDIVASTERAAEFGDGHGAISSSSTMSRFGGRFLDFAVRNSTPPVTGSSPSLMGRLARFAPRRRSSPRCASSTSRSEPECTRASASSRTAR